MQTLVWTRAGDIYSFAVLLFEIASQGQCPYANLADEALLALLAREKPPLAAVLFADVPQPLPPSLCVRFCCGVWYCRAA